MFALAENPRTVKKATIRRASARARVRMNRLDREVLAQVEQMYRQAAADIEATIRGYAGSDASLRLNVLQDLKNQVNGVLQQLADTRNSLLDSSMAQAAMVGTAPYTGYVASDMLARVSDEAVRFSRTFIAEDGLQLSDRIWRIDNHAREAVGNAIESSIIQGHSASQAATEFLQRGESVPADIRDKLRAADAGRVARAAGAELLTAEGSPRYNALRVFRTEINRAHGEAYMAAGEADEDFGGWKFLLSPRHPETDICDMHARVNRYGLGPGVYPSRDKTPWPAHPNTLSYVEIVFTDEITEEDRAGKTNRIDWLKSQPARVQRGVLGARQKRAALQKGLLNENEINTPWKVLKRRYERRGIDVDSLDIKPAKPVQLGGTRLFGMDPGEFRRYTDDALALAPESIRRLIDNGPKPNSINIIESGTSFYYNGSITLAKTSMRPRYGVRSVHDVYLHEYGHFIDFNVTGRQLSYLPNAKGGLKDSIDAARRSLYAQSAAQKERVARIKQVLDESTDGFLADLFGSLTHNRVGYGHSKTYLARRTFSEAEVFANLFDMYSRADQSGWRFVQQELPDLARDFVALIEELAK